MNAILRHSADLDWITLVLFTSLGLLTVAKYFYKNSLFIFLLLPINNKYIALNRKKGKTLDGFHIVMTLFQMLNVALFLHIAKAEIQESIQLIQVEWFFTFFAGLLLFFSVKALLQLGNGYFFENRELMIELIFEKVSYFYYGALIAFVGNILIIYVFPDLKLFIYIIILLILAVNGIGITKMLKNHQKLIFGNAFYFILYLCTLEIFPITIIIRYLNS